MPTQQPPDYTECMKKTHQYITYAILLVVSLFMLTQCRSTNRATRLCEQTNKECHENCDEAMQSYNQNTSPYQIINKCDLNCEKNYDSCVSRVTSRAAGGNTGY